MHTPDLPDAPSSWEVERRVVEVFRRSLWLGEDVTPDTRLVDLGGDSLDVVEAVMDLEEAFQVRLDERSAPQLFTRRATLRDIADFVLHARAAQAPRPVPESGEPDVAPRSVPFTQLGGAPSVRDWLKGPLHEPLGRNAEGRPQYRRRTDGM